MWVDPNALILSLKLHCAVKGAYLSFWPNWVIGTTGIPATTLLMCQSGVPERLKVFEMKYLKIERVLVKYYKAKSLDASPRKSLTLIEIRPFDLGATTWFPCLSLHFVSRHAEILGLYFRLTVSFIKWLSQQWVNPISSPSRYPWLCFKNR